MPDGWKVPQLQPSLGEAEAEAAAACVRSGWVTEGPRCEEFIQRIKKIAGVEYGVLAPNGTLALYLALRAGGAVDDSWEVIVPDLTFVASATAVVMAGARLVFADVDEHGQLDWDSIPGAGVGVEHRVVMPVHLYGAACPIRPSILPIIEDACQGLGVYYDGKPCGSFGDLSAFSFFADKTITTGGEGGFVGTSHKPLYERLQYIRNQGRIHRGTFVHPQIGQNFRMTDLQAAVGLVQLDRMAEIVARKRTIHDQYCQRLGQVVRVLAPHALSTHIPFRTVVIFDEPASSAAEYLRACGVEPRSAFYPLHRQPCFAHLTFDLRYADSLFPRANHFWEHALCLPTWPDMAQWQIDLVCDSVTDFVEQSRRAT